MTPAHKKIRSIAALLSLVRNAKKRGKIIVTTNGCFDILHIGHARNLAFAKSLGNILIVGVNSDASVRALKGSKRPILPARERAELLASLAHVDYVFVFGGKTPQAWLQKIKPHIHVKGRDRRLKEMVEKDTVEHHGGKILFAPYEKGHSTSEIIKRIILTHRSRSSR